MGATCPAAYTRAVHGLLACAALEHSAVVNTHAVNNQLFLRTPASSEASLPGSCMEHGPPLTHVAHLHPNEPSLTSMRQVMKAGTALITGASGYLGGLVADWLTGDTKSSSNLVLASRSRSVELDASLARLSMRTTGLVQHTTMHAGMAADWWVPNGLPLDTVVHTAGVLQDATLPNATASHVRRVAAGKLAAVGHLGALANQLPIKSMALMSSVAAVLGSPGQVFGAVGTWRGREDELRQEKKGGQGCYMHGGMTQTKYRVLLEPHMQCCLFIIPQHRLYMPQSTVKWIRTASSCRAMAPPAHPCSLAHGEEAAWPPWLQPCVRSATECAFSTLKRASQPWRACSQHLPHRRWPLCFPVTGPSTHAQCQADPLLTWWRTWCQKHKLFFYPSKKPVWLGAWVCCPCRPLLWRLKQLWRVLWGCPLLTTSRLAMQVCVCVCV